MDNDEIKRIFDGLKEDFIELKNQFKQSIDEGRTEHKEIKDALGKLCNRMTSTESTVDNHLINSAKKEKSNREKTTPLSKPVPSSSAANSSYAGGSRAVTVQGWSFTKQTLPT